MMNSEVLQIKVLDEINSRADIRQKENLVNIWLMEQSEISTYDIISINIGNIDTPPSIVYRTGFSSTRLDILQRKQTELVEKEKRAWAEAIQRIRNSRL